ncbi:hypothetical protein LCGC14_1360080, partial [marine sediment metagenome]
SHTIAQTVEPNKKSMDAIFELLEKRSGTDFSLYKPTTIMRRINHRMANLQLGSLVEYFEMIKNSPRELDVLFETVLIGVTEFFRDTEAYAGLKKYLEIMLNDKNSGDSIRIWSVGCATGQEPYSVGILLHELLGKTINQYHIQVFASDIDEKALNFGRKGIYPKESLESMPPDLVKRYFEPRGEHHFEIVKEIKQHTLFTRHDISNDPPFVKLDLITCRNLLIYFNNDLQKQSFQIFHYSLRPHGLLFLGKSESVSVAADLFTTTDSKKIFRKADATLNYQLRFSRFKNQRERMASEKQKDKVRNMSIIDVAKETLYYKFEHPFVIVNGQSEIKEVHGSLRLYLEIGQGTMNANLHKMANPELVTVLKALQAQVKKTGVPHLSHIVKFNLYDNDHYLRIRIAPLIYMVREEQYYLVMFQKVEPSDQILDLEKKLNTQDFVDLRIKELEDELASTKEHLQIFTEELEATNEELQTINEELQSANEELKSSNEELETSNEELQSANEELNTANHEMRLANEELVKKENELQEEKEKKLQEEKEKQEKLIEEMKKIKKEKKEKPKKVKKEKADQIVSETTIPTQEISGAKTSSPNSLFQTLSQETEEPEKKSIASFVPFSEGKESEAPESSKLRIIPNVTDTESAHSSFTPIQSTPLIQSESPKPAGNETTTCKKCGSVLSNDYVFCNKCGDRL